MQEPKSRISKAAGFNIAAAVLGAAAAIAGVVAPFAAVPAGIAGAACAFLAWRASEAESAKERLEASEKIEAANRRAELASSDAAEATRRAEDAGRQLALYKFSTSRNLSMEQIEELASGLAPFRSSIAINANGSEPLALARLLCVAFDKAGWSVSAISGQIGIGSHTEMGITLAFQDGPQEAAMICQELQNVCLTARIVNAGISIGGAKYLLVVGEYERPW